MNKKGFAISVILYTIIFLIITIFYILLGIVKTRYNVNSNLRDSIVSKLNGVEYIYTEYGNEQSVNVLKVNPNGGRVLFNGEVITSITGVAKRKGRTINLPDPERDSMPSSTTKRTISYNANGGNFTPSSQEVMVTLSETYSFNEWDGSINCGTLIDGVYTFPNSNGTVCTKTASWIVDVELSSQPITLPAAITHETEQFYGWKSSVDNKIYPAGSSFTVTRDTVMTAQWQEPWAENIGYSNNGIDCTGDNANVQCAIDILSGLINN